MEKIAREFFNYLFDIGIVSISSIKELINIYNHICAEKQEEDKEESYQNEYLIKEILSLTLENYFESLSKESTRFLSLNIISKFAENKSIEKLKKARALFIIYSRNKKTHFINKKIEMLMRWKHICNELADNKSGLFNSRSIVLETSSYKKELEEMKLCTFRPEINRNFEFNFNRDPSRCNQPAHVRLYNDHERIVNKKAMKKIQSDSKESNLLSFSPNTTLTTHKNSSFSLSKNKFFERQNFYKKSKSKNREKIRRDLEEDIISQYTFSPQILKTSSIIKKDNDNNSSFITLTSLRSKSKKSFPIENNHSLSYAHSNSNLTAYDRLYQDKFRRDRNLQIEKKQQTEDIICLSKTIEKERNLDNQKSKSKSRNYEKKNTVDLKRIEELYNDHKKNKNKITTLQKKIEIDQGITFKPEICKNLKYSPSMKFLDRNKKLLDDKKNFVEVYNQIFEDNLAIQKVGLRNCPPEELETINKGVIERLYTKEMEKILSKNNPDDRIEKEKLDYKKFISDQTNKPISEIVISTKPKETIQSGEISVKNKYKQNKNLTFGVSNNSKDREHDRYQSGSLNIQSSQFSSNNSNKILPTDSYTFGKENKLGKHLPRKYNYEFDEGLNIEVEENNPESVTLEDRGVKITSSSNRSNHKGNYITNKKNIQVETADTNYISKTNFAKNQKSTEKSDPTNEYNSSVIENFEDSTYRSNTMKNYLESKSNHDTSN